MPIRIVGAREHNLRNLTAEIPDGITAITGVSGSGKSSLAFDTLYHEAHRRLLDLYAVTPAHERLLPARVDRISALMPAVAVGQNQLNRNPNSTVATATGIHPFLRLLYANFGERACPICGAPLSHISHEGLYSLLADPASAGSLVTAILVRNAIGSHATLLSGLSKVAAEFADSSTPGRGTAGGRHDHPDAGKVLVDGSPYAGATLDPVKRHDIGLVAGFVPDNPSEDVASHIVGRIASLGARIVEIRHGSSERAIALSRICPSCGRSYHSLLPSQFHQTCPHCQGSGCERCGGSGVDPAAAATRVAGATIGDFLAMNVDQALNHLEHARLPNEASALLDEIGKRLAALRDLTLNYISLDRPSPSLSRGEAQRLRLSVCLASKLEMLHVLDEPTVGLHALDTAFLFRALRRLSGPVVVVEHDRGAILRSDHVIDLGPGAGSRGGKLLFAGAPQKLLDQDSQSGTWFSRRHVEQAVGPREDDRQTSFCVVRGARANNLAGITVRFPIGRLTAVTGVSGSGKSSLVHAVLGRSIRERDAVNCDGIDGPKLKCTVVDQGPIGRNPRSTPATFTKLSDMIRELFAGQTGLSASVFSFNRPEGGCPECSGLGATEVAMRMLPSFWIKCPACEGRRFNHEAIGATITLAGCEYSVADIYEMRIEEFAQLLESAGELVPGNGRLARMHEMVETLVTVGLGYLELGQPSPTLSGGEAQRIKLARHLGRRSLRGEMLVLDEPSTGLHPADIAGLLNALSRLVAAHTTIVMVEHNTDLIRVADWVIDLGPGAGPMGGDLVFQGQIGELEGHPTSLTARALREADAEVGAVSAAACRSAGSTADPAAADHGTADRNEIRIAGASVHNLHGVDVSIPHRNLTVVTGVSGSGKSSLVRDVLEAEARARFLETLSVYERQSVRGHDRADATIDGLGVTIGVDPGKVRFSLRSTVGRTSEIHTKLAVLLASSFERRCLECGSMMRRETTWVCPVCGATAPILDARGFFQSTYAAACVDCHGVGTHTIPNPSKLIVREDMPLCSGAMYSPGFFPKGYLCKPFNGGYYVVQAFARKHNFDPATTPWNEMSEEARHGFLFGEEEPLEVTYESKTGRTRVRSEHFGGFFGWIGDWDVGGAYTEQATCETCGGSGLRPESLAVTIGGESIATLCTMPISKLRAHLEAHPPARGALELGVIEAAHATAVGRTRFLERVGLGYLHLNRHDGTLSAGEIQRVRLASLLGSGLSGLTLILDEPSRGLHPAEVDSLIEVLEELRDEGNTVIVVEHEPAFVAAADHLVEMGPDSGENGGRVLYTGPAVGIGDVADSYTAAWINRGKVFEPPAVSEGPDKWIELVGATANNLRDVTLRIPVGRLTGVCGVSGSGKSTLVIDTLSRIVAPVKHTTSVAYEPIEPGPYRELRNAPKRSVVIDQTHRGIGSPASFLKLEDPILALYSDEPDDPEQRRGVGDLKRACAACGGSGVIRHEMGFMPDLYDRCEACGGSGYPPRTARLTCRGVSLAELSGLSLETIMSTFGDITALRERLEPALELGLGYLAFRQPSVSLSGGEIQRLKIADQLRKRRASLFILDEPTVGQHLEDVSRLVGVLRRLVADGATVVVVEHHTHLLAGCDWLVELGPGAGPDGGAIIATGPPCEVAAGTTPTASYLREVLEGADAE